MLPSSSGILESGRNPPHLEKQFAGQRITVGMKTIGGKSKQKVSSLNGLAGEHFLLLHRADNEAGQVIFPVRVHPGHLGSLAANERAPVFLAAACNARNDSSANFCVELTDSEIIEEEERLRALDCNVVYAMVHQILTDGVVASRGEGELELGAHAVDRADQYGIAHAFKREAGTEAADGCKNLGSQRFGGMSLDEQHRAVRFVDVYSRFTIGS